MMRAAAILLLAALTANPSPPPPDIHAVDFRNFTYFPSCADFESVEAKVPVETVGGKLAAKPGGPLEGGSFEVQEVVYGDLTGDGRDETLVRTMCNSGGSGLFDEGFVYTMKGGKPALAGRLQGGDRAVGAVRCARIAGGALEVERIGNDTGTALGVEFVDLETWRLRGKDLERVGSPVRRQLRGGKAEVIRFAQGASSAVVHGRVAQPDGHTEYALRARSGQTLHAKITGKAAFEIMLDDFTLACRTVDWKGPLPASGEYRVFVVAPRGPATYDLTVAIQ
jgi:hypothetical protein